MQRGLPISPCFPEIGLGAQRQPHRLSLDLDQRSVSTLFCLERWRGRSHRRRRRNCGLSPMVQLRDVCALIRSPGAPGQRSRRRWPSPCHCPSSAVKRARHQVGLRACVRSIRDSAWPGCRTNQGQAASSDRAERVFDEPALPAVSQRQTRHSQARGKAARHKSPDSRTQSEVPPNSSPIESAVRRQGAKNR
jgi:hypothetical protein